jgi:hypothetical protein
MNQDPFFFDTLSSSSSTSFDLTLSSSPETSNHKEWRKLIARLTHAHALRLPLSGERHILDQQPRSEIFNILTLFYQRLASNRDRKIADRLSALSKDAQDEDEYMVPSSLGQLIEFFQQNLNVAIPKITLTPDGTLRARWINGPNKFLAIEFTGGMLVRVVAEVPRQDGSVARYFFLEHYSRMVLFASYIGLSLQ